MSLFKPGEATRRHLERLEHAVALSERHIESLESLIRSLEARSAAAEAANATQMAVLDQMLAQRHLTLEETQRKLEQTLNDVQQKIVDVASDTTSTSSTLANLAPGVGAMQATVTETAARQERVQKDIKAIRSWMKDTRRLGKETDERFEHLESLMNSVQQSVSDHVSNTALLPSLVSAIQKIQARFWVELRGLRKVKNPMAAAGDPRFLSVAEPLLESRRTTLGYDRLYVLWQSVQNAAPLGLPLAEVGSYRGGSAFFLASAFKAVTGQDAEIHIVDTFEGHPDHKITEIDSEEQRGKFGSTTYDDVKDYLSVFPGLTVHKGEATDLVKTWPDRQYCLVHLDVDLHDPTLWCLEYFGARLAAGGIMVLDDFGAPKCPGVALAVEQYLAAHRDYQTWNSQTEQLVLVKQASRLDGMTTLPDPNGVADAIYTGTGDTPDS